MATIHICDKCGVRPYDPWYKLNVHELNEDGSAVAKSKTLDLCRDCYESLVQEFNYTKRHTPNVEVWVVE